MPYVYVGVFVIAILALQPALLASKTVLDGRLSVVVPLALAAYGQTFVIVTRGVDLSVGGLISLCSALLATHLNFDGAGVVVDILAILVLGALTGLINGVLIAFMRLEPFLVTLSNWAILGGCAYLVLPVEGGAPSPGLIAAMTGDILGVPKSAWVIVLLLAAWMWLRRTTFFIDLTATGSDSHRAWLSGIYVHRRKIQAYVLSGMFGAAAAIWLTAKTASGSPKIGDEYILGSIVAVILGGTSIFGGLGSAASSVAGAMAFMLIPTLVYALNLETFWSICAQGLVLVVAVIANAIVQSAGARRQA